MCVHNLDALLFDKPIVLHANGPDYDAFFARLPRLVRYLVRRIFAMCSGFILVSDSWQTYYESELELEGQCVEVLENPIRWPEIAHRASVEGQQEVRFVFLGRLPLSGTKCASFLLGA